MDVVRPVKGEDDPRHVYYAAVLRAAMEVTRPEFGDYKWEVFVTESSSIRDIQRLKVGELINVLHIFGGDPRLKGASISVKSALRKGLNGIRVLLVHKDRLPEFRNIRTLEQLKEKVAGQGREWVDVPIYRHNGLPVLDSGEFQHLFSMLLAGRFDYYPLGVAETPRILKACGDACRDVAIVPGLLLQYDFPIYFHVSPKHTRLADRISKGLTMLKKSGAFETIWQQYHADQLEEIDIENSIIIHLENPMLLEYSTPESRQ